MSPVPPRADDSATTTRQPNAGRQKEPEGEAGLIRSGPRSPGFPRIIDRFQLPGQDRSQGHYPTRSRPTDIEIDPLVGNPRSGRSGTGRSPRMNFAAAKLEPLPRSRHSSSSRARPGVAGGRPPGCRPRPSPRALQVVPIPARSGTMCHVPRENSARPAYIGAWKTITRTSMDSPDIG
jgi:hypothetical protein